MTTAASKVDLEQIASIATPVIEGAGFELVDLEWKREMGGWILRVFIDKPDGPHAPGEGITLDGCADVSHELSTVLDVSEALPGSDAYALEVSSPGIDYPLKSDKAFARVVGQKVKVRTKRPLGPPPGRRNFAGPLVAVAGQVIQVDVGDKVCDVPLAEIEKANLVFEPQKSDGRSDKGQTKKSQSQADGSR
jgi:ribosome maturation factor RimP